MRNFIAALLVVIATFSLTGIAHARGGQGADDCPPNSTDPDCKGK